MGSARSEEGDAHEPVTERVGKRVSHSTTTEEERQVDEHLQSEKGGKRREREKKNESDETDTGAGKGSRTSGDITPKKDENGKIQLAGLKKVPTSSRTRGSGNKRGKDYEANKL